MLRRQTAQNGAFTSAARTHTHKNEVVFLGASPPPPPPQTPPPPPQPQPSSSLSPSLSPMQPQHKTRQNADRSALLRTAARRGGDGNSDGNGGDCSGGGGGEGVRVVSARKTLVLAIAWRRPPACTPLENVCDWQTRSPRSPPDLPPPSLRGFLTMTNAAATATAAVIATAAIAAVACRRCKD